MFLSSRQPLFLLPAPPFLPGLADACTSGQLFPAVRFSLVQIWMPDNLCFREIRHLPGLEGIWECFPEDIRRTVQVGVDDGAVSRYIQTPEPSFLCFP